MHDDEIIKLTNKSNKRGIFRVVTIDTTNKESRLEIHVKDTREERLDHRIFSLRVDLLDTTNKGLLLHLDLVDTTNKRLLLTSFEIHRRTNLLG